MANDYTNDAVANWSFGPNILLYKDGTDGNDLSLSQEGSAAVAADSSDKKERTTSWRAITDWGDNNSYPTVSRSFSALSSDFPFIQGGSETAGTVCFWAKLAYNLGDNPYRGLSMYARVRWGDTALLGNYKMSIGIGKSTNVDNGLISLVAYDAGGVRSSLLFPYTNRPQLDVWYHIAVSYDLTAGTARIRVHDGSSGALLDDDATSAVMPTTLLSTPGGSFFLKTHGVPGGGNDIGHTTEIRVDDLVVFKRILTPDEIDGIWLGSFGGTGGYTGTALPAFPAVRPDDYDYDFFWKPGVWAGGNYTASAWDEEYVATGGGRWNQQLIAVGKSNIYYETLT